MKLFELKCARLDFSVRRFSHPLANRCYYLSPVTGGSLIWFLDIVQVRILLIVHADA